VARGEGETPSLKREIRAHDTLTGKEWTVSSAETDSHHPVISADGHYLAWLEGTRHIHYRDSHAQQAYSLPIPEALQGAIAKARFIHQGEYIEWRLEDSEEPIYTQNPLMER
jgi:hypothetical protein